MASQITGSESIRFFLWGHLKTVVFEKQPESLDDLKAKIKDECGKITPDTFRLVRQQFENRLFYCMEANGEQFEHLIK